MNLKYKNYWRKSGLKGDWGNIFLQHVIKSKPKNFLEIGVFCGVTARNVCNCLDKINNGNFSYTGIDLFGDKKNSNIDEIEPNFLKNQKFSNPLKNLYYNFIKKENLNSISSVQKFLKKYKKNVTLVKGDTNIVLKKIDLAPIDYVFIDGGHSYDTVTNDLNFLFKHSKIKKKIILCDDYGAKSRIAEVVRSIDDFVNLNKLQVNIIKDRFAEIVF